MSNTVAAPERHGPHISFTKDNSACPANVPFVDLAALNQTYRSGFHRALDEVLDLDSLILGESLKRFEAQFAAYLGASFALGVSSGADALEIIFRALNLSVGDEIIVPANSFFASASSVSLAGLTPVFCDVSSDGLINVETVSRCVSSRTKAILAVHLYGQCVDMDPLLEWAFAHGFFVIEDAAQAHGSTYKGRKAGTLGHAAAFSFYPTKNLGALGDAGAIVTNDEQLFERAKMLRNYGSHEKNKHVLVGRNARMDTLQAAFLSTKLGDLEEQIKKRERIARLYDDLLQMTPLNPVLDKRLGRHVFHLYVVQVPSPVHRDPFRSYLFSRGIETAVHYPVPIHEQVAYKKDQTTSLPMCETLAETIISLPMYATLSEPSVRSVVDAASSYFKGGRS